MDTIAVIRLGRLGDVTLTSPTIKNLRMLYPESQILFVTREMYKSLAEILPGVNRVLPFPDEGRYFDLVRLCSEIDEFEPKLIVDLHKNFRSFHLATLTKSPYRVVYHKRRKERLAAVHEKKFVSPVPHTIDLCVSPFQSTYLCPLYNVPHCSSYKRYLLSSKYNVPS